MLYILIPVWMTLTFIQGHSCITVRNFCVHFLRQFTVDLDEIEFVEAHAYFAQVIFKGENFASAILLNTRLTSSCFWTLVNQLVSNLVWC